MTTWILVIFLGGAIYTQPMVNESQCHKVQAYVEPLIKKATSGWTDFVVLCIPKEVPNG